jgi:hypothetical protein
MKDEDAYNNAHHRANGKCRDGIFLNVSFPRKRETSGVRNTWMPAPAGMTRWNS